MKFKARVTFLTAIIIVAIFTLLQAQEREEFSIILLPDTQLYSMDYSDVFHSQTDWIAANIEKHNIKMVIHLGDIVHNPNELEWGVADKALAKLDGKVPYSLALGNHDYPENGSTRDTTIFNRIFTLDRYQLSPGWGGRMGDDNDNHYRTFSAGDMDFLVLTLEFGPTDEMLQWAAGVVESHPEHRVIVNTHVFMNTDNTRIGNEDGGRPQNYPIGVNDGQAMWDKFVSRYENIFLVVSGHIVDGTEGQGRRVDKGINGNSVIQILSDYQDRPYGGNGWLNILRFMPEKNRIFFTAYSPFLDRYNDAIRHTFQLWYDMTSGDE